MTPLHVKDLQHDLDRIEALSAVGDPASLGMAVGIAILAIHSALDDAKRYPDVTCRCHRETEPAPARNQDRAARELEAQGDFAGAERIRLGGEGFEVVGAAKANG